MTLWELGACIDGHNAAQGDDDDTPPEPMSADEAAELRALTDRMLPPGVLKPKGIVN